MERHDADEPIFWKSGVEDFLVGNVAASVGWRQSKPNSKNEGFSLVQNVVSPRYT